MNEKQVNKSIVKALFDARLFVLIITLLFLISSVVITLLMPKKYEAFGLVYPTESNSIYNVVESPSFGFEIHADRLIQLFDSQKMRDHIIKKFDLINYYEIDTNKNGWSHKLLKNYHKDLKFSRTKYLSVKIQAKMKSPEMAASIVNSMIDYIDTINQNIFAENALSLTDNLEKKLIAQELIVDSLLLKIIQAEQTDSSNLVANQTYNSIKHRNENGVYVQGDEIVTDALLNKYSFEMEKTINHYYSQLNTYNVLKEKLNNTKQKLSLPFPKVYTVTRANEDDTSKSPSTFVNAVLGLIVGFSVAVLSVSLKHNWKRIKRSIQEG